jgi:hypothetical protein
LYGLGGFESGQVNWLSKIIGSDIGSSSIGSFQVSGDIRSGRLSDHLMSGHFGCWVASVIESSSVGSFRILSHIRSGHLVSEHFTFQVETWQRDRSVRMGHGSRVSTSQTIKLIIKFSYLILILILDIWFNFIKNLFQYHLVSGQIGSFWVSGRIRLGRVGYQVISCWVISDFGSYQIGSGIGSFWVSGHIMSGRVLGHLLSGHFGFQIISSQAEYHVI